MQLTYQGLMRKTHIKVNASLCKLQMLLGNSSTRRNCMKNNMQTTKTENGKVALETAKEKKKNDTI